MNKGGVVKHKLETVKEVGVLNKNSSFVDRVLASSGSEFVSEAVDNVFACASSGSEAVLEDDAGVPANSGAGAGVTVTAV